MAERDAVAATEGRTSARKSKKPPRLVEEDPLEAAVMSPKPRGAKKQAAAKRPHSLPKKARGTKKRRPVEAGSEGAPAAAAVEDLMAEAATARAVAPASPAAVHDEPHEEPAAVEAAIHGEAPTLEPQATVAPIPSQPEQNAPEAVKNMFVWLMRFVHKQKPAEIAATLGENVNNVSSRLKRVKAQTQAELQAKIDADAKRTMRRAAIARLAQPMVEAPADGAVHTVDPDALHTSPPEQPARDHMVGDDTAAPGAPAAAPGVAAAARFVVGTPNKAGRCMAKEKKLALTRRGRLDFDGRAVACLGRAVVCLMGSESCPRRVFLYLYRIDHPLSVYKSYIDDPIHHSDGAWEQESRVSAGPLWAAGDCWGSLGGPTRSTGSGS